MQSPELLRLTAIGLALLGALALAAGAQFQNDAVTKHHTPKIQRFTSLRPRQLVDLLKRPRWLIGSFILLLAVLLQLSALSLAPLMVVQPIGAVALIVTALLNASIYKLRLNRSTWGAISLTLLGVLLFVTVSAASATEAVMSDAKLLQVVGLLALALTIFAVLFWMTRGRVGPLNYIFGAGVLFGFVASLAKVVIGRITQFDFDLLTLSALAALVLAAALGGWFVQNAYASGPPDLVIAGLTVIDPAIAVVIAIFVLGEASQASAWVLGGLAASGLVAATGVFLLSKFHPDLRGAIVNARN
jgi:drug/metabolite transporter (DMT)-like permease